VSKRSEKEARENADLVALLAPALAATALLSYFQYRALKKQFLSGANVKRIDDPEAHIPILAISTLGIVLVLGGLYAFAVWAFKGHVVFIPAVALSAYAVWLLIKRLLAAQAACLLGVVVDQHAGAITFPTFFPALRTVRLAEVAQLTREDGNKLLLAGEFGSYVLRFSDKRRRDECIHLLRSRSGARMLPDVE
jgi:hypothetical protein